MHKHTPNRISQCTHLLGTQPTHGIRFAAQQKITRCKVPGQGWDAGIVGAAPVVTSVDNLLNLFRRERPAKWVIQGFRGTPKMTYRNVSAKGFLLDCGELRPCPRADTDHIHHDIVILRLRVALSLVEAAANLICSVILRSRHSV